MTQQWTPAMRDVERKRVVAKAVVVALRTGFDLHDELAHMMPDFVSVDVNQVDTLVLQLRIKLTGGMPHYYSVKVGESQ